MRVARYFALRAGLAAPVTRGGRPVCWVRILPFTGFAVSVFSPVIRDGRIVEINILADPERLARLDLPSLT